MRLPEVPAVNAGTLGTLDWLVLAFNDARWRCTVRERPRRWALTVRANLVALDGAETTKEMGCEVWESEEPDDSDRHNETAQRFHQTRQHLLHQVVEAAGTRQFMGHPFRAILPAGVSMRAMARHQRTRRMAEHAIERDVEVVAVEADRWALKHKPSGVVVFFDLAQPWAAMSKAAQHAALRQTLDRLEDALAEYYTGQAPEVLDGDARPS